MWTIVRMWWSTFAPDSSGKRKLGLSFAYDHLGKIVRHDPFFDFQCKWCALCTCHLCALNNNNIINYSHKNVKCNYILVYPCPKLYFRCTWLKTSELNILDMLFTFLNRRCNGGLRGAINDIFLVFVISCSGCVDTECATPVLICIFVKTTIFLRKNKIIIYFFSYS